MRPTAAAPPRPSGLARGRGEMADAAGLGPVGGDTVGVQVPSPAPGCRVARPMAKGAIVSGAQPGPPPGGRPPVPPDVLARRAEGKHRLRPAALRQTSGDLCHLRGSLPLEW